MLGPLVVVALVLALAYSFLRISQLKKMVNVPYITTLWPFIYNLPATLTSWFDFYPRVADISNEFQKQNGNGSFAFYVPLLEQPWIFLTEPEDARFILQERFPDFPKGDICERLSIFLGRGIFATDGEPWSFQRKAASHLFKVREMKHMARIFSEHGDEVVSYLERNQNKKVDAQWLFALFTLDSFNEIAYGVDMKLLQQHTAQDRQKNVSSGQHDFASAFNRAQALLARRILIPGHKFLGSWWPGEWELRQCVDVLHRTCKEILDDYRNRKKKDEEEEEKSILGRLVAENLSDSEIQESLLNFLLAGRDTTAATLSFVVYYVGQHPEVEKRMLEEINDVMGSDEEEVTYEMHTQLKYCHAVVDETLRLAPPVPIDPKQCTKTCVTPSGVRLEKGVFAVWCAYFMGRSPKLFQDPLEFRPERFLDHVKHNGGMEIHGANFPFQYGPRRCLGERMAYLEVIATMVKLYRKFTFVIPEQFVSLNPSVVLASSTGVQVIPKQRK